ncbi:MULTISPECIES: phosphotransferase [unclassified Paracoccus (in: a-proteobacteria)]|uniref:phosphotransferase n=1 Tax=unclassified Paracoccus (in: a-proteobacteria) TaxID=2688777 RepID=UPI000225FC27|nr:MULTISPECIES: phosphotransferase [unclassified Paracoccus (in: a-proteobacteria)]SMG16270.1 hypothetical protein SAMN02746000_00816 [Paracoccus sp. J56]
MRPRLPSGSDPLAALAALPGVEPLRLVRDRPDRMVLEIRLDGRPAWLKLFRGADPADRVQRAETRLKQVAQVLDGPLDCVVSPLLALPEHGILITAPAPGRPLAEMLAQAGPARRATLITRMGEWLRALARTSRSRGRFGPRFWLGRAEAQAEVAWGGWIDRALVEAHLGRMRAEVPGLRGLPVERGLSHGDLTADNIFAEELRPGVLRLTGIDMEGAAEMALARDMARLLVWLESRRKRPAARVRDGIALPDWRALTRVPGLLPADQLPILRFLIGDLILAHYLDTTRQSSRRETLMRAMRAWAETDGLLRPEP